MTSRTKRAIIKQNTPKQPKEKDMNRDFPQNERQFLAVVEKTKARNFHILDLYSNFLNFESDFIKKELIDELKNDCGVDSLTAYTAVLSSAFDIDSEFSEEDRIFENEYLKKSVEILKKEDYYSNLYIKKIKFPSVKRGSWEMRTSTYKPYEAFVCRGITLEVHEGASAYRIFRGGIFLSRGL